MTALLEIKQYIRKFYIKNEVYITYAWKFLLALISIAVINNKLGFMSSLNNLAIVLMASLLCAILPANFIIIVSALFIVGHLFSLSAECALIAFIVFALMFLLYFRFSPKDTMAVLLTPLLFFLHIPYVVPLAAGLIGTPASIVSVSFGLVIAYLISYFSKTASGITSEGVEEKAVEFKSMITGIFGDKAMIVMVVAFAITIAIVYIIRRSSMDNSWKIAITAGAVSLVVITSIGTLATDSQINILGTIIGTVIAAFISLLIEFFAFNLDYSRTEKVQFEDDDYYYYVKAVPKVTLTAPDRRVKKINRAKGQR